MSHYFRDAVEQSIERAKTEGLPLAKFVLSVHITANSQDELEELVHALDVNWYHHHSEYGTRESIDSTDGRTSIVLAVGDPEQTPESYKADLLAWSADRRAARRSHDSETGADAQ